MSEQTPQQPQAPPQVSPDGRFYWDGRAWQPMPGRTPTAAKPLTGLNRGCLIAGGIVAAIIIVAIAVAALSRQPAPDLNLDTELRATTQSTVGGTTGFQVTVTDKGGPVKNLAIYVNGKDNWLDHNVVTSSGDCQADRSLGRFLCGELDPGAPVVYSFEASPKDAGNWTFELSYADASADGLPFAKYSDSWQETVTP